MRYWYAAIVLAVAGVLGVAYVLLPEEQPTRPLSAAPASPSIMALPVGEPPVAAAAAPSAAAMPSIPRRPQLTKSQQVERYLATGTPQDAYAAYQIVYACVWARRMESLGKVGPQYALPHQMRAEGLDPYATGAAACGDLSPGQIVSRVQWLEKAALAGMGEATAALISESPRDADGHLKAFDPNAAANDGEMALWSEKIRAAWDASVRSPPTSGDDAADTSEGRQ